MSTITVINRFEIRPGQMDAFIDAQRAFPSSLPACGLVGGRMYRALDGRSAVLISVFESQAAIDALRGRSDFQAHLERLRPYVESTNPSLYEAAYDTGDFR